MPRKAQGGPTEKISINMPMALLNDVDRLVGEGRTPYSDRSELIKSAVRKEVELLRRRQKGPAVSIERGRPTISRLSKRKRESE